jgi:hypothetical protein
MNLRSHLQVRENLKMKTNASVLIATLTLTAIILGVILLASPSRDAQAAMITNQPNLTMITCGISGGGDEMLIIEDKSSGRMIAYRINGSNFELVGTQNLTTLFGAPLPTR